MSNNIKFILASASPRRVDLLAQIGIKPDIIDAANIDENPKIDETPRQLALRLGLGKCQEIAQKITSDHPSSIILAADTVVAIGRRILPKADNITQAKQCLSKLSGRRHQVYTGFAIKDQNNKIYNHVVKTIVSFKRLSELEITAYLNSNEWQGKAGGYAIQGLAAAYIRNIHGSYSNIVGLPLFEISQILHGINFKGLKSL